MTSLTRASSISFGMPVPGVTSTAPSMLLLRAACADMMRHLFLRSADVRPLLAAVGLSLRITAHLLPCFLTPALISASSVSSNGTGGRLARGAWSAEGSGGTLGPSGRRAAADWGGALAPGDV